MAQHTIEIPCIADTYNDSANPNTNYGTAELLKMDNSSNGQLLLCFNFNSYNIKHKKVISAFLYLYFTTIGQKTPTYFSNYPVRNKITDEPFTSNDETIINYNNTGSYLDYGYRENAAAPAVNSWVENNITSLFKGQSLNNYANDFWCRFYYSEAGYIIHSRENTNKPYIVFTYEDVPPSAPTPTEPIGAYKDSKSVVRFAWQYNSDVGGTQKKFDLEWSTDQSTWTTVSETTPNTYYDMPADTLPAGNIYWRVRCYNEYDEVGPYCDIQSFYAIGAPDAPAIDTIPTDTARPVVSWSAFSQQVYQLQVLSGDSVVYDSGVVPGINIRSHKITAWLADGTYTIQMRIKNEYDMWSDWSEYQFVISTTKPDKPILAVQRSPYGLELTIGNVQGEAYIYRDGVPIAKVTGQKYFDHTVANGKEYRYFIRALSEDGFADSDIEIGVPSFRYGLLNAGDEVIELKHNINTVPLKNLNNTQSGTLNMYDGRKYPVPEMSENVEQTLVIGYFFKIYPEVEKIVEIADRKDIVLYRDKRGRKMYGKITGLAIQDTFHGHNVSITISATDYNEAVEI